MLSLKLVLAVRRSVRCMSLLAVFVSGAVVGFGQTATSTNVTLSPSPVPQGTTPVATVTVTDQNGDHPDSAVTCNIQARGHNASYAAALQGGVASISLQAVAQDPAGNYTLACSYAGSSTYAGSSATPLAFSIITQIATTTTVSVAPSSVTYGAYPVATVTVAASNGSSPPGSVSCSIQTRGHTAAYSSALTNGSASIPLTTIGQDPVGTYSLVCSYGGSSSYGASSTASATSFSVTQATPTITWPSPAAITYGTALSGTQLDATASVPGTFAYSPAAGATPPVGTDKLSVTFTPTDTTDYAATSSSVQLTVNAATTSVLPGVITLIAGNGVQGFTGDGGVATAAELQGPTGAVGLDGAGNVYFCDGLSRVRMVSAKTQVITTVAGNGTNGFSGDGGPATSAQINCSAMAIDGAGDVFIADANTNRIRKVSASTGTIATVAGNGTAGDTGDGGQATNASIQLSSIPTSTWAHPTPIDIGVAANGDLYFFNSYTTDGNPEQDAIRLVQASTGTISTLANGSYDNSGSNIGMFSVDPSGNIYLFRTGSGTIYEVSSASGNPVTSIAGTATRPGYSGDGGPATSAQLDAGYGIADASGNVYFVQNGFVRKVNATTGTISVVAQASAAGMGCLQQNDAIGDGCLALDAVGGFGSLAAVDSKGTLYVAEALYIRSISATPSAQIQPTTITLSCGNGQVPYGEGVTCTSTVNGTGSATPTGTISLAYPAGASQVLYGPALNIPSGGTVTETLPITSLPVGTHTVVATYSGDSTFVPSLATTNLIVTKASPVVTWPPLTSIAYGTQLSAQQLDASSQVPGTLTYSPGFGAVLPVGTNTLKVTFQANDTADYIAPITVTQTLVVSTVTPSVVWAAPAPIEYGTTLSSTQLNASANVPGTFAYSFSGSPVSATSGTVLPVGVNTVNVVFTPTNSSSDTNTNPVSASVQIQVTPDSPNIQGILPDPAAVGTTVTIAGQNFGPSPGSVTFNGVPSAITSWNNTSIVTSVPAGATTGNVVVNVSGALSNSFLFMVPKTCP